MGDQGASVQVCSLILFGFFGFDFTFLVQGEGKELLFYFGSDLLLGCFSLLLEVLVLLLI